MNLSFITIDRIVEEQAAVDETVRRQLRKNGKVLLHDGRALSDEDLLAKLRSLGLATDKARFLESSRPFRSAQEMAQVVYRRTDLVIREKDKDWVWIAYTCLWERWQQDRPSLEMIDDWMQEGYKLSASEDRPGTCRVWLKAWKNIWNIIQAQGIRSLHDYDARFPGTQSLFNWVQDLSMALSSAGHEDRSFFRERISFLEALLGSLQMEDGLLLRNCRRDLAESYFGTGLPEKGEQLFRDWLQQDPRWGWGWIGWSDVFYIFAMSPEKDPARAEQILKQGLAVPDVEDKNDLLERLADLYEETGQPELGKAVRAELHALKQPQSPAAGSPFKSAKAPVTSERAAPPPEIGKFLGAISGNTPKPLAAPTKIGRNDPCRCGSGKKFKHCCGRNRS